MTLKNDADKGRCKGDRIRGRVSISDLFVFIDMFELLWRMMLRQPNVREIWLEDVHQYQIYLLYRLRMKQRQPDVREDGLEDVYAYQTCFE